MRLVATSLGDEMPRQLEMEVDTPVTLIGSSLWNGKGRVVATLTNAGWSLPGPFGMDETFETLELTP